MKASKRVNGHCKRRLHTAEMASLGSISLDRRQAIPEHHFLRYLKRLRKLGWASPSMRVNGLGRAISGMQFYRWGHSVLGMACALSRTARLYSWRGNAVPRSK